ncbi:MAPEG family protein [Polycyclovorans algicola]|uniref:MAPEG family protein n=1 Tax=Polycyclovorans algicola TaxID=616992 RepID=UPI0004A7698B|nr:MAPEG family protein [Polycyclovorans algicola]
MITSVYAALLGLLFIRLSALTIRERRRASVALGDAGDIGLQRTIRVHANFSEYVPITLILIYMIESLYALPVLVHLLGLGLLIGRLSHAYGVSQPREDFRFRITGMALTFSVIGIAALTLLGMPVLRAMI